MRQISRVFLLSGLLFLTVIAAGAQSSNTSVGERGRTPLMVAAEIGDVAAVRAQLEGANVNAADSTGMTALHYGVRDLGKVRLLLERGANPDAKTRQGQTPLLLAASTAGSLEIVRALVAKGADPKTAGPAGRNGLTLAAGANDLAMVQYFLDQGLDVNSSYRTDKEGYTALMAASTQLNTSMVRLLLQKGADVNKATFNAPSVKNGPLGLNGLTALMMAVPYASPELVRALLDAKASVSARDVRGMTPLMLAVAAENQDPDVVKLLLAAGSDPATKDIYGETAADWAKKYGYASTLSLLKTTNVRPASDTISSPTSIPSTAELRKSIQDSTALLQRATRQFSTTGGCTACHAQHFTAMAVTAAQSKRIPVDEKDASDLMRNLSDGLRARQTSFLQRLDGPGAMGSLLFTMSALEEVKYPSDEYTDAAVVFLLSRQFTDGRWPREDESRSPIDDGDFNRTALSVAALKAYAPASMKAEVEEHLARARTWMLSARPKNTDDQAMLLYGLSRSGADAGKIKDAAKSQLSLQRPDGGWAPNPNLQSDAYVTGQALWVLTETRTLAVSDSAYRKGVQFLLKTRLPDGSWHVPSRAPKFQPYFEGGFPHAHDQWISSAGTARAVIALARFIP
jgi:ankyrin repeat protein